MENKANYNFIGNIAEIRSGFGFPIIFQGKTTGDLPFAKVGDISKTVRKGFSEIGSADHYVNYSDLKALKAKTFPVGTIVFAKIGEAIRQNFRAITSTEMLFDNNVMGIVPNTTKVNAKFLFHFLKTFDLYKLANATSVPSIRRTDIEKIKIYLPPLPEQKRIAEVLDKADALREKRRLALQKLDTLLQSVFLEMFGDPVKNPKGWKVVTLSQITKINPRFVNTENLTTDSKVSFVPMAYVSEKSKTIVKEEERKLGDVIKGFTYFENDDVLIAKITPCFENGKIALAKIKNDIGFGSTEFHVIRAIKSEINSKCLFYFLQRDKILFEGESRMTGSAGQKRVPKKFLENLKIPLPPMKEQNQIAEFLDKADALREKHRATLIKLENLFQSLQQRVFKGELFNDEFPPIEPQEEKVWQQTSLF